MIKKLAGLAALLFIASGCVSVRQHRKELVELKQNDIASCRKSAEDIANEAYKQGELAGRANMKTFVYRTLSVANTKEVVRFWADARTDQKIETTDEDYRELSRAALTFVSHKKTGGIKQNGKAGEKK